MKARFNLSAVSCVFLEDLCNELNTKSITNDAEEVVKHVLSKYPGYRIFYKDSEGCWGELKHNNKYFTNFGDLPPNIKTLFYGSSV